MDLHDLGEEYITDAVNVLVLAPLTPQGTTAYLELLNEMTSTDAIFAVVTYTQPPEIWLSDWTDRGFELPSHLSFIHGGPGGGGDSIDERTAITSTRVSPQDPMDIITRVTRNLNDAPDRPAVVSIQTLTVLLEYVDFNTAFRYLHVLIHRIRGSEGTGFYQMDPSIHDAETVNTLSVLFDVVIRPDLSGDGPIEWTVVSEMPDAESGVPDDEVLIGPMHPSDDQASVGSRAASFLSRIANLVRPPTPNRLSSDTPETENTATKTDSNESEPKVDSEEELLMDEERIELLLRQAGGRMSQSDIVENTHWSSPSVSRKLSSMEEDGLITRVQVGRGNLVFLDGHQPEITERNDDTT